MQYTGRAVHRVISAWPAHMPSSVHAKQRTCKCAESRHSQAGREGMKVWRRSTQHCLHEPATPSGVPGLCSQRQVDNLLCPADACGAVLLCPGGRVQGCCVCNCVGKLAARWQELDSSQEECQCWGWRSVAALLTPTNPANCLLCRLNLSWLPDPRALVPLRPPAQHPCRSGPAPPAAPLPSCRRPPHPLRRCRRRRPSRRRQFRWKAHAR